MANKVELCSTDSRGRLSPHISFLDQAGTDSAEEVFAVGFGLGQDFGLVAVFEGNFLQEEFDRILGLEALGDELADAGSEAVGIVGGSEPGVMLGTFVLAEFGRAQAVIGGLGLRIVDQGGKREIPFTLGAGPSMEGMVGRPEQFSGGLVLERTVIGTACHERRDSKSPQLAKPMRNA
jgi:hypothetical protein